MKASSIAERRVIKENLKRRLAQIMLVSLLSKSLIACKSVQEKIEADAWNIDHTDATIYRVVEKDGREYEEFLEILNNPEMEKFMVFHNDDIAKWAKRFRKRCK